MINASRTKKLTGWQLNPTVRALVIILGSLSVFALSVSFRNFAVQPAVVAVEPLRPPIQIYPLLKELRAGWANAGIPPLLQKNARGTRSLIIDVGLDKGMEYFLAIENGFEVVGFEANPKSFGNLAKRCAEIPTCVAIPDIDQVELPLKREPGMSYLINAGAGETRSVLSLNLSGPASTFFDVRGNENNKKRDVKIVPIDTVLEDTDVYLFKVDVQGFEYSVLKGAQRIFTKNTVRQLIFELDSKLTAAAGVDFRDLMELVYYDYGMLCFSAMTSHGGFSIHPDSAEQLYKEKLENCWSASCEELSYPNQPWGVFDDLLCINTQKMYTGPVLPLL